MKKSKAKSIEDLVKRQCKEQGIPYQKNFYRRAKSVYNTIPHFNRSKVG